MNNKIILSLMLGIMHIQAPKGFAIPTVSANAQVGKLKGDNIIQASVYAPYNLDKSMFALDIRAMKNECLDTEINIGFNIGGLISEGFGIRSFAYFDSRWVDAVITTSDNPSYFTGLTYGVELMYQKLILRYAAFTPFTSLKRVISNDKIGFASGKYSLDDQIIPALKALSGMEFEIGCLLNPSSKVFAGVYNYGNDEFFKPDVIGVRVRAEYQASYFTFGMKVEYDEPNGLRPTVSLGVSNKTVNTQDYTDHNSAILSELNKAPYRDIDIRTFSKPINPQVLGSEIRATLATSPTVSGRIFQEATEKTSAKMNITTNNNNEIINDSASSISSASSKVSSLLSNSDQTEPSLCEVSDKISSISSAYSNHSAQSQKDSEKMIVKVAESSIDAASTNLSDISSASSIHSDKNQNDKQIDEQSDISSTKSDLIITHTIDKNEHDTDDTDSIIAVGDVQDQDVFDTLSEHSIEETNSSTLPSELFTEPDSKDPTDQLIPTIEQPAEREQSSTLPSELFTEPELIPTIEQPAEREQSSYNPNSEMERAYPDNQSFVDSTHSHPFGSTTSSSQSENSHTSDKTIRENPANRKNTLQPSCLRAASTPASPIITPAPSRNVRRVSVVDPKDFPNKTTISSRRTSIEAANSSEENDTPKNPPTYTAFFLEPNQPVGSHHARTESTYSNASVNSNASAAFFQPQRLTKRGSYIHANNTQTGSGETPAVQDDLGVFSPTDRHLEPNSSKTGVLPNYTPTTENLSRSSTPGVEAKPYTSATIPNYDSPAQHDL